MNILMTQASKGRIQSV